MPDTIPALEFQAKDTYFHIMNVDSKDNFKPD